MRIWNLGNNTIVVIKIGVIVVTEVIEIGVVAKDFDDQSL
jgi:hypothetical protein